MGTTTSAPSRRIRAARSVHGEAFERLAHEHDENDLGRDEVLPDV
jgi:hypothetical protein